MIKHIQAAHTQEALAQRTPKRERESGPIPLSGTDVDIQVAHGDLIGQALTASETSESDVERARALLASGQLDSPSRIQEAAANIIDLGL